MHFNNVLALLFFALITKSELVPVCDSTQFKNIFYIFSDTNGDATGPHQTSGGPPVFCSPVPSIAPSLSGANWIWDAGAVTNIGNSETVLFEKKFFIPLSPGFQISGVLDIAVSDTAVISFNGVDSDCTNAQYSSILTCDVSSYLKSGVNKLSITVTYNGGSPSNFAGLLYKLAVASTASG